MTNINENPQRKAFNTTVGMEAVEQRQTLSFCNRAKYLEICNKSYQSLTEALAASNQIPSKPYRNEQAAFAQAHAAWIKPVTDNYDRYRFDFF